MRGDDGSLLEELALDIMRESGYRIIEAGIPRDSWISSQWLSECPIDKTLRLSRDSAKKAKRTMMLQYQSAKASFPIPQPIYEDAAFNK